MKKLLTLTIFLLCAQAYTQTNFDESKWKKVYAKNGVKVLSQKIPGSKLLAFRAVSDLNATIEDIAYNLRNVEESSKWLPNVVEKTTVKDISDNKAITYTLNDLPWPASDRDFIVMNELVIDKKKKRFTVLFYSVKTKIPEKKDVVRADFKHGSFSCKYINDNKTNVELTILADPRGSIPKWLVNVIQRKIPYDFLKKVEKRAQTHKGKNLPGIVKLLNQYYKLIDVKKRITL